MIPKRLREPTRPQRVYTAYAMLQTHWLPHIPCRRAIRHNGTWVGYNGSMWSKNDLLSMQPAIPSTIQSLQSLLNASIDSTPEKAARFFKTGTGHYAEHDQFIGIRVPTLRKIARRFVSLSLCDLQWLIRSPLHEERFLVLIILTLQYEAGSPEQQALIYLFYQKNIKHINNWDLVDSSAHRIVGAHLFNSAQGILTQRVLHTMAQSDNMWERRIAIVATWYFIRKGTTAYTFELATVLQSDSHDLIHKATGWMLREAGKIHPEQLTQFLDNHLHTVPRTMLRYAIEKMPKVLRQQYLGRTND